jgi:hypothetical protein
MPVMAVNNENQHEQNGGYRSRPRWSAAGASSRLRHGLARRLGESLAREEPGPFGDGSFGKVEHVVLGASGLNVETVR